MDPVVLTLLNTMMTNQQGAGNNQNNPAGGGRGRQGGNSGRGKGNGGRKTSPEGAAQARFQALSAIGLSQGLYAQYETTEWAFRTGRWSPPRADNATTEATKRIREQMILAHWGAKRTTTYQGLGTVDAGGNLVPPSPTLDATLLAGVRRHLNSVAQGGGGLATGGPVGIGFAVGFDFQASLELPVTPPLGAIGGALPALAGGWTTDQVLADMVTRHELTAAQAVNLRVGTMLPALPEEPVATRIAWLVGSGVIADPAVPAVPIVAPMLGGGLPPPAVTAAAAVPVVVGLPALMAAVVAPNPIAEARARLAQATADQAIIAAADAVEAAAVTATAVAAAASAAAAAGPPLLDPAWVGPAIIQAHAAADGAAVRGSDAAACAAAASLSIRNYAIANGVGPIVTLPFEVRAGREWLLAQGISDGDPQLQAAADAANVA